MDFADSGFEPRRHTAVVRHGAWQRYPATNNPSPSIELLLAFERWQYGQNQRQDRDASISHGSGLGIRIMAARAHVIRIMSCGAARVDAPTSRLGWATARCQPGGALKNLEPSSSSSTTCSRSRRDNSPFSAHSLLLKSVSLVIASR